jgi:FMN-dependent NADH-azoreductase
MNILHIDSSARHVDSVSRRLTRRLVDGLIARHPEASVTRREVDDRLPLLGEPLLGALAAEPRDEAQRTLAALPDRLIAELEQADVVVLGVPIYNFGIPAALKAWIDLVARARRTFRYTENGPVGLLADRPVYLVVASGGTAIDSAVDFATPYLRHVLGFLGLHDVRVIDASRLMLEGDAKIAAAARAVDEAVAKPRARSGAPAAA